MPRALWLLPLAIAALRGLPYLAAIGIDPGPDHAALPVGYIPKDFLQYLAFMRQAAETGSPFAFDAFTLDPHPGRFFMPFLAALGSAAAALGCPQPLALELSRIPLLFALFAALWHLLAVLLPDAAERKTAVVLVAFSGGIEGFLRPFAAWLPPEIGATLRLETWPLYGWNTFQLAYNPLWLAGLCLELLLLRDAFANPGSLRPRDFAVTSLLFALLWWTHPYTALAFLCVLGSMAAARWLLATGETGEAPESQMPQADSGPALHFALRLVPAALLLVPFALWQAQDPVYRAASSGVFGPRALSPFWYPLTLGVLGWLALHGGRIWAHEQRSPRVALAGWIGGVALLHASTLVNGYHFVSQLHVPLCIAAAPFAQQRWRAWQASGRPLGAFVVLALALFATPVFSTLEAIGDALRESRIPRAHAQIIDELREAEAGRAIVPPALGNALPAFTRQRVFVGHHFLTPNYGARAVQQRRLLNDPGRELEFLELVDAERITYVAVAPSQSARLRRALGPRLAAHKRIGDIAWLSLAVRPLREDEMH